MTYWLAIGPPANWTFCFGNGNVWGFSEHYRSTWQNLRKDDILLCYATIPVGGIVGYCKVRSKEEGTQPFFPHEIKECEVMWPLRIALTQIKIIPEKRWGSSHVVLQRKGITFQRSLQRIDGHRAKSIIAEI